MFHPPPGIPFRPEHTFSQSKVAHSRAYSVRLGATGGGACFSITEYCKCVTLSTASPREGRDPAVAGGEGISTVSVV
jgi:hypothetical protein